MDELAIFTRALDFERPEERAAFLAQVCGTDTKLRTRVDALLESHQAAGSFLQERPLAITSPSTDQHCLERPGTVIGSYKLMQQIGEGGMGVVYMAEQIEPVRRKVALKVIKPGMDSHQVIARFEAEKQALAMMDHVNIARVLDAGTTEQRRPYFVMELVHGVPITKYCDDNRLTPRQRLELFVPVCQAIQHAHQKGIIHRDIKPSNVMVTLYDGKPIPKVIDFGIAKAIEQKLTLPSLFTQYGTMVGTLEYMSPEQAEMNALGVDTRSDIYSLGVLLYELLTGTTPVSSKRMKEAAYAEILRVIKEEEPLKPSTRLSESGEALASISAQRHTEPAKLSKLMRGELDWIVMKSLEKGRNRRYDTASGLAMDVQRYLADEPVQACPPSTRYRLLKFVRRNKRPLLAASLVALALVGGIIGTTWGLVRATAARAVAVHEASQKETALIAAEKSERDATDQLFRALWSQARAGRYSRQMGQRLESLAALATAARIRPEDRLRDEAIAAMSLPDVRRMPGWHGSPQGTTTIAMGGQYRIYARTDNQGFISLRSIPDDREICRIASGPLDAGHNLYFSRDERFLLGIDTERTMHVWRVADGQRVLRDEPSGNRLPNAFSPNGQLLAVGQETEVLCFDLATGLEVNRWGLAGQASALEFHPDNRKLAVGFENAKIASVYDSATGNLLTDLPIGQVSDQIVAWHPDGDRLAVSGSEARIQIWNVPFKRKVATLEGHVQPVEVLTFHPDGGVLASHSWDGALRLWDSATGRPLLQMPLIVADRPRFSDDGRLLAAALHGEQTELLEVTPNREYRTLVSSAGAGVGGYNSGDFSPDSRVLAVGIDIGTRLWDLRSGRELAALPADSIYVFFERDGNGKSHAGTLHHPQWGLLTGGADGLLRWPVIHDDPHEDRLRLGPPRQLSTLQAARFARSLDGSTQAAATTHAGSSTILDLETGTVRRELASHPLGEVHAISGDGHWAASSGWHSDRVWLWNIGTGRMVREWIVGKRTLVYFTPDSRILVISRGDEFTFWDVATLQLIQRLRRDATQLPGEVAFSSDSRLMALEMAPAVIHLKEVATGRTLARFEDPHGDRAGWMGFTPDGTQLVVVARYASAIHVWDLPAIRARLKNMNLDWDWPEISPASTNLANGSPSIELDLGDLADADLIQERRARQAVELDPEGALAHYKLGVILYAQHKLDAAIEEFSEALRLQPDLSGPQEHLNHVAWRFLAGADRSARNPLRAGEVVKQTLPRIKNPELLAGCAPMLLLTGDADMYRQLCGRVLGEFGDTQDPRTAYLVARICALAPDTTADSSQLVQLAQLAVRAKTSSHCLHVLGLAHYRSGEFNKAIEQLEKSAEGNWNANAANYLVLAMAHQRLGHADEARKWFDKALRWINNTTPNNSVEALWSLNRHDSIACLVLCREAEALVGQRPIVGLADRESPIEIK